MSVAFYTVHYGSISRGVTRGQEGRNYPGAKSLWGHRNTAGATKSPNNVTRTFFTFASGRPQVRKWGRQTCFLSRAPSDLVTPLSIWRLVPSRNSSSHRYVAKLRCTQTADSRTALSIALKLVFRFHFGGL